MREDIKLKKYRKIHKNINNHYCNDFLNVKESCAKEGITPAVYYKICKTLNKRSVGTPRKTTNSGSKTSNKKKTNTKKQRGGTSNLQIETPKTQKNDDFAQNSNVLTHNDNISKHNDNISKHNDNTLSTNPYESMYGNLISTDNHIYSSPPQTEEDPVELEKMRQRRRQRKLERQQLGMH
jgi:hypothetical protein